MRDIKLARGENERGEKLSTVTRTTEDIITNKSSGQFLIKSAHNIGLENYITQSVTTEFSEARFLLQANFGNIFFC